MPRGIDVDYKEVFLHDIPFVDSDVLWNFCERITSERLPNPAAVIPIQPNFLGMQGCPSAVAGAFLRDSFCPDSESTCCGRKENRLVYSPPNLFEPRINLPHFLFPDTCDIIPTKNRLGIVRKRAAAADMHEFPAFHIHINSTANHSSRFVRAQLRKKTANSVKGQLAAFLP